MLPLTDTNLSSESFPFLTGSSLGVLTLPLFKLTKHDMVKDMNQGILSPCPSSETGLPVVPLFRT